MPGGINALLIGVVKERISGVRKHIGSYARRSRDRKWNTKSERKKIRRCMHDCSLVTPNLSLIITLFHTSKASVRITNHLRCYTTQLGELPEFRFLNMVLLPTPMDIPYFIG